MTRISFELREGVADVRLTRADKMNALDDAMFDALIETGERLKVEPGLRAVVLSGEGRAFCAGLDMSRFKAMAEGAGVRDLLTDARTPGGANRAQQAVMVWTEIAAPVIAAVHGAAFGGGFQLALGCDLRFVAPDAQLSAMEIRWGIVPDMGGMALLPRLVRPDVARELTWSGRIVRGDEALALGLATRVCADPHAGALEFAREIAGKNPDAVRAGKRLLDFAERASVREILVQESAEQARLIGSPNQLEAVAANLEQRTPVFRDQG